MSVYKNRMIRFMYKDIYLPIHCYATKKQFYSLVGECACMTECKFMSESKRNQDYRNSEWGKDHESPKNKCVPPLPLRKGRI
jgi:hypothetical protein